MMDKKVKLAIAFYEDLGNHTGGLVPEFKHDLDALKNGEGFTDHAKKVFEAFKHTRGYQAAIEKIGGF